MADSLSATGLDKLRAAISVRVERGEIPGAVWLIARGDEVHVDAVAVKRLDGNEPMTRETVFRIASMTKPIVAAAALMLVDDGLIGLHDPVERWLPELAHPRVLRRVDGPLDDTEPAPRSITVEDLLTLRMGVGLLTEPTYNPPFPIVRRGQELQLVLAEPDPRTPHPPDEWIRLFGSLPLMYPPGVRWQYNIGSLVLGVLIARAAGQSLEDLLRARVFEPLAMAHTGFWMPAEVTRTLPGYYMADPATGQVREMPTSLPDEWSRPPVFPSAAAGLLSTADDFLAFARLLLNAGVAPAGDRLLSATAVREMTRDQLTADQRATAGPVLGERGWGYGVGVVTSPDASWAVPGRYGWDGGYGTVWFNDPHRKMVALLLTQVSNVLWDGTRTEFEALVANV